MDAPRPAERSALAGHVPIRCVSPADQPLGDRGIQAPSDRVFLSPVNRPHLECAVAARVRANYPEFDVPKDAWVGTQCKHLLGRLEQYCPPFRPVVAPGLVDDVTSVDSKGLTDRDQFFLTNRTGPPSWWRGEREPSSHPRNPHQSQFTLLNNLRTVGRSTRLQPRMTGAKCGMTREREFT